MGIYVEKQIKFKLTHVKVMKCNCWGMKVKMKQIRNSKVRILKEVV